MDGDRLAMPPAMLRTTLLRSTLLRSTVLRSTVLRSSLAIAALVVLATSAGCSQRRAWPYDACWETRDCTRDVDGCAILDTGRSRIGLCTNNCGSDFDCPTDRRGVIGACLSLDGFSFICFERCAGDFDCPSGFFCTPTVGGAREFICLPP